LPLIGERFGWPAPFVSLGTLGILYAALLLPLLHDARPDTTGERVASRPAAPLGTPLLTLARTPSFVCLGLVSGIAAVAVQTLFFCRRYADQRLPLRRAGARSPAR